MTHKEQELETALLAILGEFKMRQIDFKQAVKEIKQATAYHKPPPTTADASVLDVRKQFRVLKYGWIYVDVNRLSEGLYQELQPVLYPKDYTKEKIILNYEDSKEYTRTTDEVIARVKENLDKCKMVDVYLSQYSTQSLPNKIEESGFKEGEEEFEITEREREILSLFSKEEILDIVAFWDKIKKP